MIEKASQPSGFNTDQADSALVCSVPGCPDTVTAGRLLREARESAGVQLATLAAALKVPVKKLQALESDCHDLLIDAVFVRALACSVCRSLKADPTPVLALLPLSGLPSPNPTSTEVPPPFYARHSTIKPTSRSPISVPAAVGGVFLLAAVVVVVFFPAIRESSVASKLSGLTRDAMHDVASPARPMPFAPESLPSSGAEAPTPGIVEVAGPKSSRASNPDSPSSSGAASGGRLKSADGAFLPPASTASPLPLVLAATAIAPPVGGAAASLRAAAESPAGARLLTINATAQPTWVMVTDAKGVVIFSRNIGAGQEVAIAGLVPLSVVVGRADAARVTVRGVTMDMGVHTKENVARFEVK